MILTDLDSAVRDYPELVQQYFMTDLRAGRKHEIYGSARGLLERRRFPLYSKGCRYRRPHSDANLG